MTPTLHATAVAIGGQGVLLLGPPGSGKSDLALRLIDRGALLIADDRVIVAPGDPALLSAPQTIAGLIEVRGLGLVQMPFVFAVPAALAVDLSAAPARMPLPARIPIGDVAIPLIHLAPFEASTPLKVELAVARRLPSG